MPQRPLSGVIRFGAFEVEPQAGILRKGDARIPLQEQPFQVLLALLERPGEVVTREELHQKVWKGESFGDLDHRLNISVNKIREALRDSADTPRFVETLPRRGYRFIAPVDRPEVPAVTPAAPEPNLHRRAWTMLAGIIFAVMAAIAGAIAWSKLSPRPTLERRRLTNDSSAKYAPVLSDGTKLYFRTSPTPQLHIAQIPLSGGDPSALPLSVPKGYDYLLQDIAPDGQQLLVGVSDSPNSIEAAYWTLRTADGSSRRVGDLRGRSARYSPDGKQIAFTSGGIRTPGSLWVASSEGSSPRRLVEVKDREILSPGWSSDGTRVVFGQRHRPTQEQSGWVIGADGTGLQCLVPGFRRNHLPAGWTPEGHLLLLSENRFWMTRSRRFFEFQQPDPVQISSGDPLFFLPVQITGEGAFHALGVTPLGQLQRFDRRSKTWEPHLGGISANVVTYS